ncbi:MAG: hypothetical protein LBL92_07190 [Propionibacteriaceae bacterium]|jgi:hypothetical protein|nr:hypothetical protein [Propionibacteriaceae bacterium]
MALTTPVSRIVTATWLASADLDWPAPVDSEALLDAAQAAENRWGLAGVSLRWPDEWLTAVVVPTPQIPAGHPLLTPAPDRWAAGLIAVCSRSGHPSHAAGRWLVQALGERLADRCPVVEAHGASRLGRTIYTPAASWLTAIGFRPLIQPPHRYRLSFRRAIRQPSLLPRLRPRLSWPPETASATRGSSLG